MDYKRQALRQFTRWKPVRIRLVAYPLNLISKLLRLPLLLLIVRSVPVEFCRIDVFVVVCGNAKELFVDSELIPLPVRLSRAKCESITSDSIGISIRCRIGFPGLQFAFAWFAGRRADVSVRPEGFRFKWSRGQISRGCFGTLSALSQERKDLLSRTFVPFVEGAGGGSGFFQLATCR